MSECSRWTRARLSLTLRGHLGHRPGRPEIALRLQEAFELFNRERRREMASLRAVAPQLSQHRQLLARFRRRPP